jgi:hypothetical protein
MSIGQNKKRSSLRLDQRSMNEIEIRLSALEGLGQQTERFGTKIRSVRQGALLPSDLMRKGEWVIDGTAGNLVILDADGELVDSGYSIADISASTGADDGVSAVVAYRATAIQNIPDQIWTAVQFDGETTDLQSEFTPDTNAWSTVAPKLGVEDQVRATVEYNSKLYGITGPNGALYEWDDDDEWTEVAAGIGSVLAAVCVYDSALYAAGADGKLYVWNDTDAWVEKAGAFGEPILSLCVYNSKLYGGTGTNGKLVEWNDVDTWVEKAPQLGVETQILALIVYDGALYGGTIPSGNLYVWNDVNAWTQKAPQLGTETGIYSLCEHNLKLYGGTGPNGKLYEWDGLSAWASVADQLTGEIYIFGLAEFNGSLYGSTYNHGKLFWWNGSDAWIEKAAQATETIVYSLTEYNSKLYGGTYPNGKLFEWDGVDGEFVAGSTGTYVIHADIAFESTNIAANKHIIVAVYKNGSEIARSTLQTAFADEVSATITAEARLNGGNVIEIYVWHDMGGICEINYGSAKTRLEVFKVIQSTVTITTADAGITDHGELDGLLDNDHPIYYLQTAFINASAGAGDAGKPIVLDAAGHVDATMINDADVDHGSIGGLADDDHTQYHTDGRANTWLGTKSIADLGTKDHHLLAGLTDDDHTQYLRLAGRSGGQTAIGGTDSGDDFTLQSTSHATKGHILFGTSGYDEVNNRLGLGLTAPNEQLELTANMRIAVTTASTIGVILKAGNRFIHDYKDATADGHNIFIGENAGNFTMGPGGGASSLASDNIGIGLNVLDALTTGYKNIGVGHSVLSGNTEGYENVGIGYYSLLANTTGNYNVGIGSQALRVNTSGYENVAIGAYSLYSNTTGRYNYAMGTSALRSNTTGRENVSVGVNTLYSNNSGYWNVGLGTSALFASTGHGNIGIGRRAAYNLSSGNYNIIIGYYIDAPSATGSQQLSIGNLIFGTTLDGTGTTVSTGNIGVGTNSPDRRFHVEVSDAATNSITYAQRLSHITSNTAVAGFGTGLEFELEENDGTNRIAGILECFWTDAGEGANADADIVAKLMQNDGAAVEVARIVSNGDFKIQGDYYVAGNQGLSGTLTLDDGANWRVTLTFTGGILTGQTTGASSGATATWV